MIAISLRFPSGRYHATPWGRHVNEGVPEWPPSPWRILRALVSTWKRTMPQVEEKYVRSILAELCSPPVFHLPEATVSHTRHYMPWDKNWNKLRHAAKTLVFDTFVVVPKNKPVIAYWPDALLEDKQRDLLAQLLENLPYLGRAESWCTAELVPLPSGVEVRDGIPVGSNGEPLVSVYPMGENMMPDENEEIVRVLIPRNDLDMTNPLDENHPLLVRTSLLRSSFKCIDPPGGQWVRYLRSKDCFAPSFEIGDEKTIETCPTVIRFMLDGTVLPPITETLAVANLARAAAMSRFGGAKEQKSKILSGKDAKGRKLEGHQHTFYLPSDEDGDGKLDHLTLYAPEGFDAEHQGSLCALTRLYERGRRPALNFVLLGMSEKPEDWKGKNTLFYPSRQWRSVTPFMLSRHPKVKRNGRWKIVPLPDGLTIDTPNDLGRFPTEEHLLLEYGMLPDLSAMQKDGPVAQLCQSLQQRGLPEALTIEPLPEYRYRGMKRRWLEFKRYRRSGPRPAVGTVYGFRLVFPEPVTGPIALGYGCHFGLGLFVPEIEANESFNP